MKLANTAIAVLSASSVVVYAAPAQIKESLSSGGSDLVKREDLERALLDFESLKSMRAKRELLEGELSAREYQIVTTVLEAVKNTQLAPVVLKYFLKNVALQSAAVEGVVLVVKNKLISAATLLKFLVQSGLITTVINDIIADCAFFAQVLSMVKAELPNILSLLKSALPHILKRDTPFSNEEGLELLRKDGLIEENMYEELDDSELEKRDIDGIVLNVMNSLAESGLATQVVETALTDPQFFTFGALLIGALYANGLLKLQSLISAVSQSGLLPALITDLVNVKSLRTIAGTAVAAFEGKCGSVATSSTNTYTSPNNSTAVSSNSTAKPSKGLLGSLLGSGILGGLANIFGKPSGSSSSGGSKPVSYVTTPVATKALSTTTTIASTINPCTTAAKWFKRERLNIYY